MKSYAFLWLTVSAVAQTPATPPPPKTSPDAVVQKQRETTLAATQTAVEKQKAAVAASIAASIGKQGQSLAGKDSFFTLAPLTPPQPQAATAMPDVSCDPVPEDTVAPFVLGAAQRESLDPKLVTAVIQQESGFRPCAISDKGAQGLMQLMPDTADRFSVKDPFDAKQNVDAGAKYLKELITKYSGNLALALSAYNAGPETVDKAGGIPNIPETTDYVKAILTKLGIEPPAEQTPAPITDPVPPAAPQQ
ncbi:MAG TPA: lytic transglycosylase domain-containing protein [Bryobacteraceae bacterium]|nr:lytic transglycosylase domain-containing protein [Bryobacteraceae bacterium]